MTPYYCRPIYLVPTSIFPTGPRVSDDPSVGGAPLPLGGGCLHRHRPPTKYYRSRSSVARHFSNPASDATHSTPFCVIGIFAHRLQAALCNVPRNRELLSVAHASHRHAYVYERDHTMQGTVLFVPQTFGDKPSAWAHIRWRRELTPCHRALCMAWHMMDS